MEDVSVITMLPALDVCHVSTRPAVFMIPAKTSCPSSWTREYYGYIMTSYRATGRGRLMFECVDEDQESLAGSSKMAAVSITLRLHVVTMASLAHHIIKTKK